MRATNVTIHLVPDDTFDDWIVREDGGPELGHFPTREAAELAARNLVRKCGGALVIHLPDGRRESEFLTGDANPNAVKKGWLARWFGI